MRTVRVRAARIPLRSMPKGGSVEHPVMLAVPVFGQRQAECGVTSLKAVSWFHGKRISAKKLGDLCRTSEEGVDHEALALGAAGVGATAFTKTNGTVEELRWFLAQGYPVIVGWWSMDSGDSHFNPRWSPAERRDRDCGHFSVVCGITSQDVILMDPQCVVRRGRLRIVGRRRMPLRDFMAVWYDTDTNAYERVDRWYMVINYEGRRFAGQFAGGRDYAPRSRA